MTPVDYIWQCRIFITLANKLHNDMETLVFVISLSKLYTIKGQRNIQQTEREGLNKCK